MKISQNFNKYIFGVVLKDLKNSGGVLEFQNPPFKFRVSQISKESTRNLLKYLDFNYPRNDTGIPLSYTKLDSKQMSDHVNWIERQCAYSKIEMQYITKQWENIIHEYRR